MRRPGLLLLLFSSLMACAGSSPRGAPPAPKQTTPASDAGSDASISVRAPVASLEQLAARGASDAPLMREAKRVADASSPVDIRAPADRDVCVRAIFAADRPVRAWIEDESRSARGDVAPEAMSGLVPPRGPACARKGELLRLVIDPGGSPIVARAVLFQAP